MVDIVTRQTQLVPLTHAQVDQNFTNLNIGISDAQDSIASLSEDVQSVQSYIVDIRKFGAKCDGINDDSDAIIAALASANEVEIDGTPLVTKTIVVPPHKKLRFKGGLGNTNNSFPPSRLIKSSGMSTEALVLLDCAYVDGGGIYCQPGNTGDGVALKGNGAVLSNFLEHGAGGVGVRVGTDAGNNANSCVLNHVTAQWNGGRGIYVHDGSGSDCNAATLIHCFAQYNGGDGIRLGHTYWTTVINGLSEFNNGWGLYLSGDNNGGYPECRYANIIGGDYNEQNGAGIISDASYFATIVNPDWSQKPTTPANGLQGSAVRTYVGGMVSQFGGLQTGPYQNLFRVQGGTSSPAKFGTTGSNSVGDGARITFETSVGGTWRDAAQVGAWQFNSNTDGLNFLVNAAGTMTSMMKLVSGYNGLVPGADNTYNIGFSALRWGTFYAGTGTINTSDEREKQQIYAIEEAALRAVRRIKFKQFKFNDAVTIKGEDARIHFGVIAQQVKEAFEAEGLDAFKYGLLCYDEWGDIFEPVLAERPVMDEDGNPILNPDGSPAMETYDTGERTHTQVAGNRYGVRYDELIALKMAALENE